MSWVFHHGDTETRRKHVNEGWEAALRRSVWVTGAIVMQFLCAVGLLTLPVYLLALARSPAIQSATDAAEDISGLRIAVGVLLPPAIIAFAAWYGLWKERLWGWWLALICNAATTCVLIYSMIDDGWENPDGILVALTAVFALLCVLLLVPAIRRFYWRATPVSAAPEARAERL